MPHVRTARPVRRGSHAGPPAAAEEKVVRSEMRKAHPFAGRPAALKLALLALAGLAPLCYFGRPAAAGAGDGKEKAPDYSQLVAKSYDFRFGQNPFAPSNASSTTGTFIPGSKFLPASRCANCHGDAHAQW